MYQHVIAGYLLILYSFKAMLKQYDHFHTELKNVSLLSWRYLSTCKMLYITYYPISTFPRLNMTESCLRKVRKSPSLE